MKKNRLIKPAKNIFQGVFVFLIAVLLAVFFRVFLFSSFKIPSPSMEPAIIPGDYIIVNKLIPGPRIIKNFFSRESGEELQFVRLPGKRDIQRNDVLVFNFPYSSWNKLEMDLNLFYAKRCVAIPGDTFYIENGIYKIQGLQEKLGSYVDQEKLSGIPDQDFRSKVWNCFPYDTVNYKWNIKNFGPLYIPAKEDILMIDSVNIRLYKNLIEYETGEIINVSNDKVFLGDSLISDYTFLMNYYFVAGDYVYDSQDSRYWGLLPEDHIVGKAILIWQSKDMHTGAFRWDRFFRIIE